MRRKIAVITGTRAEYGLLRPVLEALNRKSNVDAGFIVTGVHLKKEYGNTFEDIEKDSQPVWKKIPIYEDIGGNFSSLPNALSNAISGLDSAFQEIKPDIVIVLGDRLEALAGALTAYFKQIITAHLHGGEKSDFHMDDSTRHAITRFAHLHFPATRESVARLLAMGEEGFRIHLSGAPGLDDIRNLNPPSREKILNRYGFSAGKPFFIFLFHPETIAWNESGQKARLILTAILKKESNLLALYPNGDPGSKDIIAVLEEFSPRIKLFRHLPRHEFIEALSRADALIGNSSCGLIEGSFLGTSVLHLGERNKGREHGENILFTDIKKEDIENGLSRIQKDEFKQKARNAPCPWGDGTAGEKIAEVLSEISLGPGLLAKRLVENNRA